MGAADDLGLNDSKNGVVAGSKGIWQKVVLRAVFTISNAFFRKQI